VDGVDVNIVKDTDKAGSGISVLDSEIGSSNREVALRAFHTITEKLGKGKPEPTYRGEPPAKLYRNDIALSEMRHREFRHAFVAEGPITAIKGDLVGGNIATMGKSISGGQIEILRKAGVKRVYWAIDPDAVAELTRLCRETSSDFESFYVPPMDGYGDHGDMSFDQVRYQVEKSAEKINAGKIFLPPFIR